MKLCFPTREGNGFESKVYSHFGSAPVFMLIDTETEAISSIDNANLNHEHGKCSPMKALSGQPVDAIIVGGIGAGAVNKLNTMGIKVYRANAETIQQNLELFQKNELPEISLEGACRQHGGCSH